VLLMYLACFSALFRAFGDCMVFTKVWKYIVHCSWWISVLACVNSGGNLVFSPKRVGLTQARVSETLLGACTSNRSGDELQFWARSHLA